MFTGLNFGKSKREKMQDHKISSVEELQQKVNAARELVSQIEENTREVATLHEEALYSLRMAPDAQEKIDTRLADTQKNCSRVFSTIKELQRPESCADGAALERMRVTQVSGLRVALSGAMERHEEELQRYARGLRALVAKGMAIGNRTQSASS